MVFNIEKLMPKPRKELDPAKRKEYAEHYATVMQERFGYIRKPVNAEAFDLIADYIGQYRAAMREECDYPKRGLFLFGEKGTGKTTALQLFSGFCDVDYLTVSSLTRVFSLGSFADFWKEVDEYKHRPLIVDDLGCEENHRSFGNEMPIADFIREREILWKEKGVCTFFSSNAKGREDVAKRYGESVCSRILGMCEFVKFTGNDNRLKR